MSNIQPDIDPLSVPGFMLWQVSKLWQRTLTNALRPFNIGSTEFVILGNAVRFSQLAQPATPALLMDATKIDRMTTSQILRSLEKKGLIERIEMSQDKRTFYVVPTSTGVTLADDALGKVIQAHTIFFGSIQDDIQHFLKTMQKLIEGNNERVV